ncbi:MAG: UPF0182 family protein [Synergistaceae bacterium]|nr:UPF0182 family protein [Synergistaceae bacterium]
MNINDIFEKLMRPQERQWSEGDGNNGEDWRGESPSRPQVNMPKLQKVWIAVGVGFVFVAILLPWIATFLTDIYWYEAQGFASMFWRRFFARWELFAAAFVPTFIIYLLNWRYAFNSGADNLSGSPIRLPHVKWIIAAAAAFMAFTGALSVSGSWGSFLKFMHPTLFGEVDPLFGKDVSFYVFTLPFLNYIRDWLQGVLTAALIGSGVVYYMTRSFVFDGRALDLPKNVRLHLAALSSAILAVWGVGCWLGRYELLFSPTGVVFGAGYTDVHVLLPAITVLTVAAFLAAALLLVNIVKPMWKMSAVLIASLLLVGWLARSFVPGLVQQYSVKPNEYEMEKPYLDYHLDYTRRAFGLNDVKTIAVTPEAEVTAAELRDDQETVQNIHMWDYSPLLRTYKQLQAIRTYYDFNDVYIDRYDIGGRNRQVMLAVRELDLSDLQNPTWVNTHLEFTHGYGVVMNPVNEVAAGGLPLFFMKDLPSQSTVDIKLDRPEIYYGTMPDSYVLVNTAVKEFDYPMGASNMRSTYGGSGGVKIDSMWRRLLFAFRFRDTEILFTGSLKPESRIMFYRNVRAAFKEVAPFLIYDGDTYPVIFDGRIIWVQDAFTWSSRYPYSKPVATADRTLAQFNGVNYLRNSVKATVDAYDGRMKFYVVNDKDPLVMTWKKIFPGLFNSGGEMSPELWKHMRYPEEFFEIQSDVFRTYHMTDTNTYYNREDVWEITPAGYERRIRPNYVTMKLWGGKKAEFAIIVPYMPLGRNNLIGWMAGRCDPGNYGQLLVYQFPKQKLIYGPTQIEALIDQNPEISAQLSLWSQRGSDVIRGDLLVVPVGKSLIYVQPLYLKAEKGELPELKRIIVSTGGRVAWAETFGEAIERLVGQKVVTGIGTKTIVSGGSQGEIPPAGTALSDPDIKSLANMAQKLYHSAMEAQRNGDWARYGSEIKKLGEIISKMKER